MKDFLVNSNVSVNDHKYVILTIILGEFQFTKGRFIALGPKTYHSINLETDEVKMGSKGIPHNQKLQSEAFLETLFCNNSHYVTIRSLRLNNRREMARITQLKKGLSDIFVKFRLDDDAITCKPLTLNGQYL